MKEIKLETFNPLDNWFFIEWPKQIIDVIDKPFSILNIRIDENNNRVIELRNK